MDVLQSAVPEDLVLHRVGGGFGGRRWRRYWYFFDQDWISNRATRLPGCLMQYFRCLQRGMQPVMSSAPLVGAWGQRRLGTEGWRQ